MSKPLESMSLEELSTLLENISVELKRRAMLEIRESWDGAGEALFGVENRVSWAAFRTLEVARLLEQRKALNP